CLSEVQDVTVLYPVLKDYVPAELEDYVCTAYPELDYYSSKHNVDPMLTRAVALIESGFIQCRVAVLCPEGAGGRSIEYTANDPATGEFYPAEQWCDAASGYYKGYREMYDPADICSFEQPSSIPPEYTFRGLGLMQTLTPPYTYWPAEYRTDGADGQHVDLWNEVDQMQDWRAGHPSASGIDVESALACSENFNPFNSTDSACLGTLTLSQKMKGAKTWVEDMTEECSDYSNHKVPDLFAIEKEPQKAGILVGFVGLYKYAGVWDEAGENPACGSRSNGECWGLGYCEAKTCEARGKEKLADSGVSCGLYCQDDAVRGCAPTDPDVSQCYGKITDFLEFVNCRIPRDYNTEEGRKGIFIKMGDYIWLTQHCTNSFCPAWKRMTNKDVLGEDKALTSGDMNENFDPEDPYAIYGDPWSVCSVLEG
ncbi:hypothetical protein H0O02_04785, partial [Candidatus Micrarchaeota archaeon]|nr:hypothetical protein [Candidatus Micrarchaeota archaeon]